jgi:hypothetical protein
LINKIVTTFLTIGCFILAKGQITKKSILLGGQIRYASSKLEYSDFSNNSKSNQGTFDVSIGKAFKENVIYGFNASYGSVSSKNNYYSYPYYYNSKLNSYSFGLFRRDYEKLGKDLYFFTEAGLGYTYQKSTYSDSIQNINSTGKGSQTKLYLTPGLSYRIYKKLQLEIIIPDILSINYNYTNFNYNTSNSNTKQNNFYFNSSLNSSVLSSLGVGFHFIL